MRNRVGGFALSLMALAAIGAPNVMAGQSNYQVVDQWKIGGEGGWDYLLADGAAHRLYVTHGTKVEVVDTTSGQVTNQLTGLHGIHGVALDDTGKYGYVSDGGGNAVVVFERSTLKVVETIAVGTNPDAIIFEPVTKTVWAFNGRSKDASVIDAATNKVVATISLPGKPEFAQVDGQGNLYNNIEDKNVIVKLDAKAKKVVATWPISCDSPSGLAIDTAGHRLFSVCDGKKMAVTDYTSGKQLATPAIGDGPDAAGYNAKDKLAFASCGEGVLSVVNAGDSSYPTVQTLTTQRRARTMTYDATTDRIYTVTAEFGTAPAPTADNPRPRPPVVPGSFTILVIGRK